jgi:hypothetical protein
VGAENLVRPDGVTTDSGPAPPSALTDLAEIMHLTFSENPSWLVAVQFRFSEGFLQVEVDPDDDTVEVSFDASHRPPLRCRASKATSISMNGRYANLLGSNCSWWWLLRNQQQYEDAFQIELGPRSSTTTFQYLAMASRLHLRHVTEADEPPAALHPTRTKGSPAPPTPNQVASDKRSPI